MGWAVGTLAYSTGWLSFIEHLCLSSLENKFGSGVWELHELVSIRSFNGFSIFVYLWTIVAHRSEAGPLYERACLPADKVISR